MHQLEVLDYVNEQPRRRQKRSEDTNQTGRRVCQLLLLSFAVLCIIQAILNVSLRVALHSGKESTHSGCNTTDLSMDQRKDVEKDCERKRSCNCNRLQEQVNALNRDNSLLENTITDLNNKVKNVEEERDRLRLRLGGIMMVLKTIHRLCGELSGCVIAQQCPENWTEVNSRCYFLSTNTKTWEDSRRDCQSKGADLVVIDSREEQRALYQLGGDADLLFWIGLSDTTGTNQWKWVDGSALTTTFWQSRQPERSPTKVEDCVEMYHNNPVLANWNNAACRLERRWLCEREKCPRL